MFIAYPLIWSVLLRNRLRRLLPPQAAFWLMGVVICLLLWFEETWVIVDHRSPPLRHYVHYFGFYLGVTATIVWLIPAIPLLRPADLPRRRVYGACSSSNNLPVPRCFSPGRLSKQSASLSTSPPSTGSTLQHLGCLFFEEFNESNRVSRWQGLWLFVAISVLPLAAWLLWSALLQAGGFDRSGVP